MYIYLFIYIFLKKCEQIKGTGKSSRILAPFNIVCLDIRSLVSVDKESLLAKGVNQNHAAVAVVTVRGQTCLLFLKHKET